MQRAWVMLVIAGLLEVVWAIGLKSTDGFRRPWMSGFTVAMMLKDLSLSQHVAETSGVTLPMAERATELYQQFSDAGQANLDFSAIIKAKPFTTSQS